MNREIRINLSTIGYDEKYILYNDGYIIDQIKGTNVDVNAEHEVRLLDITGKKQRIRLKTLYRKAFHKEYSNDTIVNLPNEQWKPIEGTKGKYFISNYGRLKSYCRYNARLIKPYCNQYDYLRADIRRNGKRETALIHRLVAEAFIKNDNPEEQDTIDHIDGNKHNNTVSNLRWLSRSDNAKAYYNTL